MRAAQRARALRTTTPGGTSPRSDRTIAKSKNLLLCTQNESTTAGQEVCRGNVQAAKKLKKRRGAHGGGRGRRPGGGGGRDYDEEGEEGEEEEEGRRGG